MKFLHSFCRKHLQKICAVGIREGQGSCSACCLQQRETSCSFSAIVKEVCQLLTGEWIGSVRPTMSSIFQNCVHWICCQQIFWTPFFIVGKLCFIPPNAIRELRATQNNDSAESFSIFIKWKYFHIEFNGNVNFLFVCFFLCVETTTFWDEMNNFYL